MRKFNLLLTIALLLAPLQAWAADPSVPVANETSAAAVPPVTSPATAAPPASPVVIELFSSQACPFCPQADRLFSDLAADPHYIALACHVDYDAPNDPYARSFCTERQNAYIKSLGAGVSYTPQLIVNGASEAVGYKADDIGRAIKETQAAMQVAPLTFTPEPGEGGYKVHWRGRLKKQGGTPPHIWLAVMMAPESRTVESGPNSGRNMSYTNIVSRIQDMGTWPVTVPAQILRVPLTPEESGFALIVQDDSSRHIVAAGQLTKIKD